MNGMANNAAQLVNGMAIEAGFDMGNFELAAILRGFLTSVTSGSIDSGGCKDSCDIWVPFNGAEYHITIQKSRKQLELEGKS